MNLLKRQLGRGVGSRVSIGDRYQELSGERSQFLESGREYSRMSLPYLLPASTQRGDVSANQHGYSSANAQAVNHLSNKLITTLFPPQTSFFRTDFKGETEEALKKQGYLITDLKEQLIVLEKKAMKYQERISLRKALTEVAKHLIVAGNCILFLSPKGYSKTIPLDSYVIQLTSEGNILELIIEQCKNFNQLPEKIQKALTLYNGSTKAYRPEDKIKFHWYVCRQPDGTYLVYEEADGILISGKQVVSKESKLPWINCTWNRHYNENYGRGYVEDNSGDFYVSEFLSEAIVRGMVLMADIKFFLKPGSQIDPREFSQAMSGEVLHGNIDDLGVLQLERYADYTPIAEVLEKYERRIGQAFLVNSAVRRDAERVTTLELKIDAQELEVSLGGIYSSLAQDLQRPIAIRLLQGVNTPPKIMDNIEPSIITGLEALGRAGDMQKIMQFSELMQLPNQWPEAIQDRIDWDLYQREAAISLSMEVPFLLSREAYEEKVKQAKQDEMVGGAAQEASKAIPKMIEGE